MGDHRGHELLLSLETWKGFLLSCMSRDERETNISEKRTWLQNLLLDDERERMYIEALDAVYEDMESLSNLDVTNIIRCGQHYLMVDNKPQVRLQLRDEVGVQIIPSPVSPSFIQIRGFINIATWRIKRNKRECDRENQIDMWEERDFFLAELFGLRPYEPDPEPEDWNSQYQAVPRPDEVDCKVHETLAFPKMDLDTEVTKRIIL
ncbi:hypothetical protein G5I_06033 [Acromyrmex echinatior]|uniref:Uncharacterized protein n=1 Tax=Acromyrmex echinatior TaxID=103372 RepID=F4WJZ7_ACREC|nr:hypothetical protein G5I_06033 [Acromyrmex echinatior]